MHISYYLHAHNSGNVVLLQYIGDERAAVPFMHGNAKGLERAHIRTCPSVLRGMENECNHATPATVYRKLVTAVPPPMHAHACEATTRHKTGQKQQV